MLPTTGTDEATRETLAEATGTDPTLVAGADGRTRELDRGAILGRYIVLERLGAGGMGIVYAAFDPKLDRKIALKLLRAERQAGSEEDHTRLLREAQAMAKITHPNVVAVHDVGVVDDKMFVAMEFIDGVPLSVWLRERRRSWREILELFRAVGRGLSAAHALGVIHRDLKPDNIMVDKGGRARVMDFGLARAEPGVFMERAGDPWAQPRDPIFRASLTQTGALLGTPAYMAPEQWAGLKTEARADQFSFCVSLWEALFGERPFQGDTMPALALAVLNGDLRGPTQNPLSVPIWLRRVVQRGLVVDPKDRWPSIEALMAALDTESGSTRRLWAVGAAFAGVLGLAGGAVIYTLSVRDGPDLVACDGQAALVGVWDTAAREAVEASFTASGLPYSTQSFASTAIQLDAYALQLQHLFSTTCEARRGGLWSSRAIDLQVTCAERRHNALAALVSVLREADASAVERASQAASQLPAIDRCSDFAALSSEAESTRAHDPVLAARIEAVHERLAHVWAEYDAGHYTRAHERAVAVVGDAERLSDDGVLAEALIALSATELARGNFSATGAALHRSFDLAETAQHDRIAAGAAVRLVQLHGEREKDIVRAETWAELAGSKLKRIGDDGAQRLRLLVHLGQTLSAAGRMEESQRYLDEAMTLAEKSRGRDPVFYLVTLNALASLEIDKGALDTAEPLLRRSLELREAAGGPTHPSVAVGRHNLARLLFKRRDFSRAAAEFRRAIAIRERSLGPEHRATLESLNGLGAALAESGDVGAGFEIFRRVLEIEERRGDSLNLVTPLNNFGQCALEAGDFATAATIFERARIILVDRGQDQSPDQALVLYNLGALRLEAGAEVEALPLLERSLALRQQIFGPEHLEVGYSLTLLAEAELAAGRRDLATAHAERAITVLHKRPDGVIDLARARLTLAELRWRNPRTRAESKDLARQAIEDLAREAGSSRGTQKLLSAARLWLATH